MYLLKKKNYWINAPNMEYITLKIDEKLKNRFFGKLARN